MRIAVLHQAVAADDPPDELDVLVEAAAIRDALAELGHDARTVACTLDLTSLAAELRGTDLAFNVVETLGGSGRLAHLVPSALAAWRVPFTGSSAEAILLSSNKVLAKRWLEKHGVSCPAWPASGPCIVKPLWEDASIGIDERAVVPSPEAALELLAARGPSHFAEAYVEGREINVSLLEGPAGPEVMPIAEIRFVGEWAERPRIVGYAAKWEPESFEYQSTVRAFDFEPAEAGLLERLRAVARAAWEALSLAGYARVDLRVAPDGTIYVLEVNANPCLSPDAGFAAAVLESGVSYPEAIRRVVQAGLHSLDA